MVDPIKPEEPSFKEKLGNSWNKLASSDHADRLKDFATKNKGVTVTYIVLIIGILLCFLYPLLGGAIVGIVAGIYFAEEILYVAYHLQEFVYDQGLPRIVTLGAVLFALFIAYPLLIITAAVVASIKELTKRP
jgi:hypothetical protein